MTFTDFTIFYLTMGSPAGVLAFLTLERKGWRSALMRAVLIWFAWPLAAIYVASRPSKIRAVRELLGEGVQRSRNSNVRKTRAESLSNVAAQNLGASATFAFRETVERYVALAEAVEVSSMDLSGLPAADFFVSAGSRAPEIGTLCLARKNREKLRKHLAKARVDLTEAVTRIPATDARLEARGLLVLLFEAFGDTEGRRAVTDRLLGNREAIESPDMVGFKAA